MKPVSYKQRTKPHRSRLCIQRQTGWDTFRGQIVSPEGNKPSCTLHQMDVNLLAAFLDNWRTDINPLNRLPTDYQVDAWVGYKTKVLKQQGQL